MGSSREKYEIQSLRFFGVNESTMPTPITDEVYLRAFSKPGTLNRRPVFRRNIFALFFPAPNHPTAERQTEAADQTRGVVVAKEKSLQDGHNESHSAATITTSFALTQVNAKAITCEQETDGAAIDLDKVYPMGTLFVAEPRVLQWMPVTLALLAFAVMALTVVYVVGPKLNRNAWADVFHKPVHTNLQLQAVSEEDAILLKWNRAIAMNDDALSGVLDIVDGHRQREIQLSSAEIATGSILYRNPSAEVTFHLSVHTKRGTTLSESTTSR
jgi:hypothetical protein